ncbi:MAG TPA: acyltransferase [Thermoanaerobaculia bacterium]
MARNVPLGYLRMFLTLLVVAHHAVLAYHPYAPPPPPSLEGESLLWAAFPVVDSAKGKGIDLFVAFNDMFFMSLLFLISGVFAWGSLAKKGAKTFLRDRFTKLGLGFAVSAALLAPLAYLPTFLQISPQAKPFVQQWLALGSWPAGPAWFLWVLLLFVSVFALLPRLSGKLGSLGERPAVFFLALAGISALAYLPMAAAFSPMEWVKAGPFFVQISRLAHYGAYFLIGAALGAYGVDRGLFARDGKLARRWPLWGGASLLAFAFAVVMFVVIISTKGGPGPVLSAIGNFAFVLSCAASSLAFIALFVRFARRSNRVADSLSANAFGIYLVHYACVSWLQLAMLRAPLSGAAKGAIVTVAAILISWALTAIVRRIGWRPAAAPVAHESTALSS